MTIGVAKYDIHENKQQLCPPITDLPKRAVEEVAREDGTTLNQFIVTAVAEKLAVLKTADLLRRARKAR